jgi:hypothetical protein
MPQVFISFFAKIGITGLVGTVLGYVAYTLVTVALLRALTPKADMSQMRGLMANTRGATDPQQLVYGTVRKGGTITYLEATGTTNEYLHMILVLAGHEVNAIGDIYINDEVATLDGSGFVTSQNWNSKIRINKHLGTSTQTTDADLLAESAQIDSNFRGRGIAYLYIRLQYDQDVFPNGIPLFSAVVQGKKVYDPRTSTTAYSANAALCIRDYLTDSRGLGDSNIDDTSFSAAANVCDENVPLDGGGEEDRYTINGVLNADMSIQDCLQQMVTACGGSLWWGGGSWKLKPGYYTAPVKTLTLDDIVSEINLQTRIAMRDNFNIVRGTFNDAGQRWIAAEYPEFYSAAFVAEDDGVESPIDLELPLTTSSATAQRLAKQLLFRNREQLTFTADFGMEALELQVGDIIALTIDRYGWSAKEFEVVGWTFGANGEAGDLRVTMTLRETSSAAFSWSAEESAIIGNNSNLPNPFGGLTISSLTATGGGRTQGDGTFINTVIVDWADVQNKFLDYYEVEWKATADTDYAATTTDESSIELSPLVDGIQYTIRVRAVTVAGVKGTFTAITHTPGGDTTAPAAPTSVSATGGYRQIIVKWVNPTDADFKDVEVFVNSSNTTAGATAIGTSAGTEFTHGGLAASTTNWYFVKARDFSGNASAFSTGASGTTLADPSDGNNGDTIITGRVYYQTLQASAPSTPSASSYNTSTATFVGLTAGWSLSQPSVDITDTSVKEWSSAFQVTIDGATSAQTLYFSTPTGAIQVTADIESDNYVAGTSGWKIERDTGNAEFQNATIRGTLNATDITTGTISADRLPGLAVANSTSISAGISRNTTSTYTVSFSGVKSGTKLMVIMQLAGLSSSESPYVEVAATATNVTLDYTTTNEGWLLEGGSGIEEPQTYVSTGTTTSTSGTVGFNVTFRAATSGSCSVQGVVAALVMEA